MSRITIFACLACLVCLQFLNSEAGAQEVRKAIRDYKTDRVFNYQPSDPWNRGKLFNIQTKRYGKFFNCDDEESKRNSPYICWKPHTEKDLPPHVRMIDCIRNDLSEVRQRIKDGAGACYKDNCNCDQCQSCQQTQSNHCADCASASHPAIETQIAEETTQERIVQKSQEPNGKFGLVKGKILSNSESSWQTARSTKPASRASVAKRPTKKSLIDRIR